VFAVKCDAGIVPHSNKKSLIVLMCSLRERIAKYRYWPVEVFRSAAAGAGGGKKGKVS
jgi:hypothetical protein